MGWQRHRCMESAELRGSPRAVSAGYKQIFFLGIGPSGRHFRNIRGMESANS